MMLFPGFASSRIPPVWLIVLVLLFPATPSAQEEYGFDELEELEKKNFTLSGYAELQYEHLDFNQDALLYLLDFTEDKRDSLDRLTGSLQLSGSYSRSLVDFTWLLEASGAQDQISWTDSVDIFEAYVSLRPSSNLTVDLGKKVLKWGKGYAWNPVGFVERPKNPNDPNLAREGFIIATADFIRSFDGPLKTIAFTPVLVPVYSDINDDFGVGDHLNFAAKLYLLYLDTDIDLMVLGGGSKTTRLGMDFSRNLSSNFEVHGELAWFPGLDKPAVTETGNLVIEESDNLSALLGIRYLTENEITWIAELYHNGNGFSEEQMEDFYLFTENALSQEKNGTPAALARAQVISRKGYGSFAPMRNYLYLKASIKDPSDFLYLTPSLTTIFNLDDSSFTLTPELLYKGFDNLEIRLRASLLSGPDLSEYDEKKTAWKCELRIRYSF